MKNILKIIFHSLFYFYFSKLKSFILFSFLVPMIIIHQFFIMKHYSIQNHHYPTKNISLSFFSRIIYYFFFKCILVLLIILYCLPEIDFCTLERLISRSNVKFIYVYIPRICRDYMWKEK
jgi:hypothetical protein